MVNKQVNNIAKSKGKHQKALAFLAAIRYNNVVKTICLSVLFRTFLRLMRGTRSDSLDSGSSVHCGRAGSSPASRTKETVERLSLFFVSPSLPKPLKPLGFQLNRNPRGFFACCKQALSIRKYFYLFPSTPSATGRQSRNQPCK